MPKETFINLNEEKKKKIFDAAILEFSNRRFSEASINQVIKTAGIPRGSFYQYFDSKEDLYLYILTEIGKEKMEAARHLKEISPDADFFESYLHMLQNILSWAKSKPLYYQVGLLMDLDDSEFIKNIKASFPDEFQRFREQLELDKKRGLIRQEVNTDLVIDMIYTLNVGFIKEFYQVGSEEVMLNKVSEVLNIIKGGIAVV